MIFFGNQTPEQLEQRLGIKLTDADRQWLTDHRQEAVNKTMLAPGMIHIYDLPFMIMCDTQETAVIVRDMLTKYDCSSFKESLQVGWEA